MTPISLKRGASLDLTLDFQSDAGAPIDLTGATITSQVRDSSDNLVLALTPVATANAGEVRITVADTSLWPLGLLRCDVRVAVAGMVEFSDAFLIQVTRSVTQ
jgi:hypothetical protein